MSRMFPPIGDADNASSPVIKENDLQKTPDTYTGAHKKVISEITIMASVRRGWQMR